MIGKRTRQLNTESNFFHAHIHSQYSTLDGMTSVKRMVEKAARYGQPGMALTDHGNMGGIVALYKACKENGILPFPGFEGYLLDPNWEGDLQDQIDRYHFGMMALTERGYMGLVELVSKSYTRPRFSRFPRLLLSDLAEFGQSYGHDVALTTGCYFGLAQQSLVHEGPDQAKRVIKAYANWFPNTYVEVQHHNYDHSDDDTALGFDTDDKIVDAMFEIGQELGLPIIATQDAHYCDQSEKKAHGLMKRMVYGGEDPEWKGDSFHMATAEWVADHYYEDQWSVFEDGYADLIEKNKVRIKPLDKFVIDVPSVTKTPDKEIRKACETWLKHYLGQRGIGGKRAQLYRDELDEQLSVIEDLGMASYFVIVKRFVEWCRSEHIAIETRGSGNGSLVLYGLGITQVDSVEWDCMPERFISRDRKKPPDVDIDIEDARRGDALLWWAENFDSVQIGTWGKLGITVNPETGEEKGSVFATWITGKRNQCFKEAWEEEVRRAEKEGRKPVKYQAEDKAKVRFKKEFGWMQGIKDVQRYSGKDYVALKRIAHMDSVYKSYGVHAGGVLLSGDNVLIEDYIPTMLVASSDTRVTCYDMDAVEEFGLLKMDLLGQTSLSVMRRCQQMIGVDDPTDFSWIPLDDKAALRLLRTGRTDTGIFHFEGWTKSKGGKELGVKSVKDAILVQALYMPGCMDVAPGQSISMKDLYLRRRNNKIERDSVTYLHPAFEQALKPTYGCVVFQEQVIQIMRNLGMSIASINKFFKVVKDSGRGAVERNKERMAEVRQEFDDICHANGIDPDEAWAQTASFVAYGFNKNHATGYGIRSYRTAYLKAHYPLEYMTALLQSWAGSKKEPVYVREAKRMEIPVLAPDINISGASWTLDQKRKAIRRGLVSIAGIGEKAAQEIESKAPYSSYEDFVTRVNGKIITGCKDAREAIEEGVENENMKGILKILIESGAMRSVLGDV